MWLVMTAPVAQRFAAVDAFVEAQMEAYGMPAAAVGIVEGDRTVYVRGYGRAGPAGPPTTEHTPFLLASVTKSFTALAIMPLVEDGLVALDAPVQRYLPAFELADAAAASRLTVADLVYQTSGFSTALGNRALIPPTAPLAAYVRALASVPLAHPVGAAYEYSNTNYRVFGQIVEAVTGEAYPRYVEHRILRPLGMRDSYAIQPDALQPPMALAVRNGADGLAPVPLNMPVYRVPSGGMVASAEDLTHYLIAQLNGGRYRDARVLSPGGVARLHTPSATISAESGYAMGWVVRTVGGVTTVSHVGAVLGHRAYVGLLPATRQGVALVLALDVAAPAPNVTRLGREVLGMASGMGLAPITSPIAELPEAEE
jgi:CubicO group peptidase (beta-lactamase class C family)